MKNIKSRVMADFNRMMDNVSTAFSTSISKIKKDKQDKTPDNYMRNGITLEELVEWEESANRQYKE